MSTAALVLVAAAGLACPAHAWWRMRRGASTACCLPETRSSIDEAVFLHRDQQALRDRLAAPSADENADRVAREDYAVRS
jgi:hypothetical protein